MPTTEYVHSLTRFYTVHILILPALTLVFIGIHLFTVMKQGISAPPGLQEAAEEGPQVPRLKF